ncbi:MAG: DNA gyrase subunit A [Chloroflexota bacterium]|nr:DNA gyrase subunit A [Chloroflexota bacterium]MDE2909167.1 DNA gyrase subunit A [Chloroflexota bacterium]
MDNLDTNALEDGAGAIRTVTINEEMRGSYLNYAMSVIVARALPDARDGLKPVHRRILFAMHDMGLRPGAGYKKSARLVGEVLGKYHPHGDQTIYDAMARMAQDFSLRYPLVDGQGNFGSQDGDKPAAMRYTEARMANIASELLTDINMDTVDFAENYDNTQEEPTVLPARLPNLLLNGASGIAVGMATSIPPHNLRELAAAITHLIDHYSQIDAVTVDDLMQFIKGPDFPTGATIVVGDELREAYAQGKGRVAVRSGVDFEERGDGFNLVISSIPYQVSKSAIIERIVSLVREGRIEAIRDLRDESDRRGLRLVVELKRHAQPQRVLNQLYKYTQLQSVYSIQMLALVNGEPRTLSLKRCLQIYIEHRYDVIVRRSEYDLARQRARAHVLSGLLKAVANIDAVIQSIRNSENVERARTQLMANFELTEVQANAILDMQLRRLSALERQKLQEEYDTVQARIAYLEDLLASPQKILDLIREDVAEIAERYGDERKTTVAYGNVDLDEADLYRRENVVISLTENGYIKRVAAEKYKQQRRGGKGMRGMELKDSDRLMDIFFAHSHDSILFFSNKGKVYSRKSYDIPETQRDKRGTLIQILLPLTNDERITALLALPDSAFERDEAYCVIATRHGRIKRMELSEFQFIRPSGLVLTRLHDDDTVGWVKATRGDQHIVMVTADGKGILFRENEVRVMGRIAAGVRGMRLRLGDEIAGMDVLAKDDSHILVVTRSGYGKRTTIEDYNPQRRYGYGVITLKRTERKGPVVAVRCIGENEGIMLISQQGTVIRTDLSEIRAKGRNTEGVTVMDLDEDDEVAGIAIMNATEDKPTKSTADNESASNHNGNK